LWVLVVLVVLAEIQQAQPTLVQMAPRHHLVLIEFSTATHPLGFRAGLALLEHYSKYLTVPHPVLVVLVRQELEQQELVSQADSLSAQVAVEVEVLLLVLRPALMEVRAVHAPTAQSLPPIPMSLLAVLLARLVATERTEPTKMCHLLAAQVVAVAPMPQTKPQAMAAMAAGPVVVVVVVRLLIAPLCREQAATEQTELSQSLPTSNLWNLKPSQAPTAASGHAPRTAASSSAKTEAKSSASPRCPPSIFCLSPI
jgi:hypothetical protein